MTEVLPGPWAVVPRAPLEALVAHRQEVRQMVALPLRLVALRAPSLEVVLLVPGEGHHDRTSLGAGRLVFHQTSSEGAHRELRTLPEEHPEEVHRDPSWGVAEPLLVAGADHQFLVDPPDRMSQVLLMRLRPEASSWQLRVRPSRGQAQPNPLEQHPPMEQLAFHDLLPSLFQDPHDQLFPLEALELVVLQQ